MKKITAEAIVTLLDKTRQYCPTVYSLLSTVPQTTLNEVAGGQQQAAALEPELDWDDNLELGLELEDYEEETFETLAPQEIASALDPVKVLETPYPRVYIVGIDWFGRILLLENLLHLRLPKGQPPANGSFRVYCIYGAENLILAKLDEGWQQIQQIEAPHYLLDENCTALFFSTTNQDLDPGTLLVFSESLGNLDLDTAQIQVLKQEIAARAVKVLWNDEFPFCKAIEMKFVKDMNELAREQGRVIVFEILLGVQQDFKISSGIDVQPLEECIQDAIQKYQRLFYTFIDGEVKIRDYGDLSPEERKEIYHWGLSETASCCQRVVGQIEANSGDDPLYTAEISLLQETQGHLKLISDIELLKRDWLNRVYHSWNQPTEYKRNANWFKEQVIQLVTRQFWQHWEICVSDLVKNRHGYLEGNQLAIIFYTLLLALDSEREFLLATQRELDKTVAEVKKEIFSNNKKMDRLDFASFQRKVVIPLPKHWQCAINQSRTKIRHLLSSEYII